MSSAKRKPSAKSPRASPDSRGARGAMRGRDRGANSGAGRSSWEQVASWYDATVGIRGSPHHRKAAIPTVMSLAEVAPGELVLDVGCGQGVLAHHVLKAGGRYLGVDASEAMIKLARRRREGVAFEVGDARDLTGTTSVGEGSVAVAVFMLSLQDMDPLEKVVASATQTLVQGGRLVVFLVHPAFRPPRASGWGYDPQRKLTYRRIERYLTPAAVPMKEYSEAQTRRGRSGAPDTDRRQRGATISFHRPVQDYVNALASAGLFTDAMVELADPVKLDERESNPEVPLFLGIRARQG